METEQELAQIVARNLTDLRKAKHLTQGELATKIGYSDKSISKWELGKAIPSVDILKSLAEFYDVTVDYIISAEPKRKRVRRLPRTKNNNNRIVIISMAVCFIWFVAGGIFGSTLLNNGLRVDNHWIIFLWAVPPTFFAMATLTFIFWRRNFWFWLFLSIFLWTFIACFAIHWQIMNNQNIWFVLAVAAPLQVGIVLGARIK